jgi:DNA-binding MarR family transcriptional regulator
MASSDRDALDAFDAFDSDLCDRLLSSAELLLDDIVERAAEIGLTRADYRALRELVCRGTPMRPFELACALRCSRAHLSKIIQRLVEAGFVAEQPVWLASPSKKTLAVTPAGHEAYAHASTRTPAHPLRVLDAKQRKQLHELLSLLDPNRAVEATPPNDFHRKK